MKLRAFKMVDLSTKKNGPDGVHYETIRDRVKDGKYVEVIFYTGAKNKKLNKLYFDFETSKKIKKAFELYELWKQGRLEEKKYDVNF